MSDIGARPRLSRRRALATLAAGSAIVLAASVGQAMAANDRPNQDAGAESQAAAQAADWFSSQRLAPNGAVSNDAFAAVAGEAAKLPVTGGTWTERTSPATGDGVDFSDSPQYIDPTSDFSNSGAGDQWVAGRITALAVAPNGDLFAGGADGGVWKSTDDGTTWSPETDGQGTLSIGALLVTGTADAYTVYVGTGEANTSSDSYAGIGVLASTDGGSTWNQVGGSELNGALIFRLVQDGDHILAATSHGLYSFTPASSSVWTAVLQPVGVPASGNFNLAVGNMITDVIVVPGTNGQKVLAVAGWRGGAPTNGLYLSTDGAQTFNPIANPKGWVPAKAEGRTTLAYSATGDRLYAIVQSPYLLNVGTNGQTLLQGVYVSMNGDPTGPWTMIANSSKLAQSGSAQAIYRIGRGYGPGVQAWYNQFLAVDPADSSHLYLGLEEVYETQNTGANWSTIGPYWNFGFRCFSYDPFEGTCDHRQSHPDQHAAVIANGTLYVGNDGGVYSRDLTNHAVGTWTNLNRHLDVLQYYSAAGSGDHVIYGGLQDNGSNKVFDVSGGTVMDDMGQPIDVASVQVFGGDGGYTLVDPANSQNVITEYVGLTALKSTDGGANWHFITPDDPNPRFIAPIAMDRTDSDNLVAGGADVWYSNAGIAGVTAGTGTSTDWQSIFDVRTATGGTTSSQVTALDAVTVNGTHYVAAAWCGPCNPAFSPTSSSFKAGIVMLDDSGGTWHATSQVCTFKGCGAGLPNRYISGVRIDTSDPTHAYLTLSGFSRKWMIGPDDPGVGHVFETTSGTSWTDISGNLPDVPMDDLVYENGNLVVATDFGVYTSADDGATWSRYGTNLPNVVVNQLTLDPNGDLVAATHGRGVWTIAAP